MATHTLMQFFTYAHLRDEKLQAVSREYALLAQRTLDLAPDNHQRDAALWRLLEAKDCAVRSLLMTVELAKVTEQLSNLPKGFTVKVGTIDAASLPHRAPSSDDVPEPKPTAPG